MDESKRWFSMFSLIFELVSAFAGIGLSLGFPGVHQFPFCRGGSSDGLLFDTG
jgi:Trk-type K+ transport system membrane component